LIASGRPTGSVGLSAFGLDVKRHERATSDRWEIEARRRTLMANLSRVALQLETSGVPLIVCTVACNMADWRPESSTIDRTFPPSAVVQLATDWVGARKLASDGDLEAAAAELAACVGADESNATLSYELGSVLRELGEIPESAAAYRRARDNDVAPIRAPTSFVESVRSTARRAGWVLVDIDREVEGWSDDGIPGAETFVDYCHFSFEGHRRVALTLAGQAAHMLGLEFDGGDTTDLAAPELNAAEMGFAKWWLGNVAVRQGNPERALSLLLEAAQLRPESARPRVSLAQAYRALGKRELALEALAEAVALEPGSAMAKLEYGSLLSELGRFDSAERTLLAAQRLDAESPWVLLNLGMQELRRNRPQEALAFLERAAGIHSTLPGVQRNIGLAYVLLNRQHEARRAFVEALRHNPFDEPAARRLADVARQSGDHQLGADADRLAQLLRGDDG
jgi:tetratricopeptide (TPR) repeat protein